MPNVISKERKSVTYLESRKVLAWMESVARERGADLSVILREATSAYFLQHQDGLPTQSLTARRTAAKAEQRRQINAKIRAGTLTPQSAQEENAPVRQPVRIVDLWPSIRRHVRGRSS
jgi:hypothetical protein